MVVDRALPTPNKAKVHHPALPYAEAPTAVKAIRESTCKSSTRLALEFLILTAGRAGEVKGATWSEIDLDARTWIIPADRMKKGMEHRVPMSDRCMAILEAAKGLGKGDGLVFPNKKGKSMNNAAFALLLDKAKIPAVPHGFRSTFRDWVIEQTATPIGPSGKPPWLTVSAIQHGISLCQNGPIRATPGTHARLGRLRRG